jgi:hypothetical protein
VVLVLLVVGAVFLAVPLGVPLRRAHAGASLRSPPS